MCPCNVGRFVNVYISEYRLFCLGAWEILYTTVVKVTLPFYDETTNRSLLEMYKRTSTNVSPAPNSTPYPKPKSFVSFLYRLSVKPFCETFHTKLAMTSYRICRSPLQKVLEFMNIVKVIRGDVIDRGHYEDVICQRKPPAQFVLASCNLQLSGLTARPWWPKQHHLHIYLSQCSEMLSAVRSRSWRHNISLSP